MKAPDKIYIGIQEDGFIDCGIQQTSTCPNEYIRKDALLKLLKASRKDLYNWHFHKEQECWKTYDEIIDKLNEL